MKKIPEKYELEQEDLEEAIIEWLNKYHTDGRGEVFEITFKVDTKRVQPKGGPIGGMSDPIITETFSAVAEKVE